MGIVVWYFALGAKSIAFKQTIPAMLLGYLLAAISISCMFDGYYAVSRMRKLLIKI